MRTIKTFITELFIRRRLKQYAFLNCHVKHNDRYIVANLYSGKFYHTLATSEYTKYADIWHKVNINYIVVEHLILIK